MFRKSFPMMALAGGLVLAGCADSLVEPKLIDHDATILAHEATLNAPEANHNAPEAALENRAPAPGAQSIAEIAIGAGFNELVSALSYVDAELGAGLVDLFLSGKPQFTVFAPTDAAFEGLYSLLQVEEISDLPAELVLDVLLYHVVHGRRAANSVVPSRGSRAIKTLLGATFSVTPEGQIKDVFGQTANILTPNISASNGIIHVIDTVILPLE